MSAKPHIILHIIYIHGFQGDHTTFQAFPTDVHHTLRPLIPPHIELRSILYPTYKSRRPIVEATEKFLQWLETLPEGPVILCGHSMGGLLAAEAATSRHHSVAMRVVGLIGYDVPYLGMHPHVVVSGIASLLPHKKREKEGNNAAGDSGGLKTEKEMNDKRLVDITSAAPSRSPSPNVSQISLSSEDSKKHSLSSDSLLAPPSLLPTSSRSPHSLLGDGHSIPLTHSAAFISHTIDFLESHANDRLVHFFSKHRSEPITAATRWIIESLEFGVCMFDPKGLKDRYAALGRWQGDWIVFWTVTVPRNKEGREMHVKENWGLMESGEEKDATVSVGSQSEIDSVTDSLSAAQLFHQSQSSTASPEPIIQGPLSGPQTKSEDKATKKQVTLDQKIHKKEIKSLAKAEENGMVEVKAMKKGRNAHSSHHFVLLPCHEPSGVKHRWEQVKIHGAKDEVEAHCGLFMRDINLEYDAFIRRVAEVTKGWVDKLTT